MAQLAVGQSVAADGSVAAAAEARVALACAIRLDAEGNVLSEVPTLLAAAVARLVEAAAVEDAVAPRARAPTRLTGVRPPAISLDAYAARLCKYCKCSPVAFVAAFAYMARLHSGSGGVCGGPLRVDALTAHRLMSVGVAVATKLYDDRYYSNGFYAEVAGVSLREFNAMELDLLFRLGFRARCSAAELAAALDEMAALAGGRPGCSALLPALLAPALLAPACMRPALEAQASCDSTLSAASVAARLSRASSSARSSSLPSEAEEEEELVACAASAAPLPLPWDAAAAAAAAAEAAAAARAAAERTAPPRRSRKRCSMEAAQPLLLVHSLQMQQQQLGGSVADAAC